MQRLIEEGVASGARLVAGGPYPNPHPHPHPNPNPDPNPVPIPNPNPNPNPSPNPNPNPNLVAGGPGRPAGLPHGYYARPTVFADVPPHAAISREEIFGPVRAPPSP